MPLSNSGLLDDADDEVVPKDVGVSSLPRRFFLELPSFPSVVTLPSEGIEVLKPVAAAGTVGGVELDEAAKFPNNVAAPFDSTVVLGSVEDDGAVVGGAEVEVEEEPKLNTGAGTEEAGGDDDGAVVDVGAGTVVAAPN